VPAFSRTGFSLSDSQGITPDDAIRPGCSTPADSSSSSHP